MFARSLRLAAPLLARTPAVVRQVGAPASLLRAALLAPSTPFAARTYYAGPRSRERPVYPPSNQLFIGRLPEGTDTEALLDIVKEYGATEAEVKTDHEGHPKRFGFATFPSIEAATEAINSIKGREAEGEGLVAAFAQAEEERQAQYAARREQAAPPSPQLFVGKLAEVETEDLEALLAVKLAGKSYQLNRGYYRDTGVLHPFAFLRFDSTAESTDALAALQDLEIGGTRLAVKFPRPRAPDDAPRGGRDGGYRDGGRRDGGHRDGGRGGRY